MAKQHGQYTSDVVRVSPDELSFIAPSAWHDIYVSRPGHQRFPKDMALAPGLRSILNAGEEDHTRQRRILSYGFSDKAIKEQEYLIQNHVQNLISGLKQEIEGSSCGKVNLVDWFNWTVFDVVGDLAFGEPFNCLQEPTFRPWIAMMNPAVFRGIVRTIVVPGKFPPLLRFLRALAATANLDKRGSQIREEHQKRAIEKVERRLASGRERPDIIGYILRHNEIKGGIDQEEIHGNSSGLIAAGGETTSTLICGAVWYTSTYPAVLARVKEEVRQTFRNVEDIQLQNMEKLNFFNAVIQETFRLYPPGLGGQPRYVPPNGDTVSGHWIPGGVGHSFYLSRTHLDNSTL